MKVPNPLDDEALKALLDLQMRKAWDANKAISWRQGVDFSKPFVPLDKNNLFFPDATHEERLALSQYMGLMIASTFSELELTLQKMREISWRPHMERYAVNPEIIALGEHFFDEESKHAGVFQRFIAMCAKELRVDPETLKDLLPRVNAGYVEKILRFNAGLEGLALWWIVATVEEESTLLFYQMKPHREKLDPLYYELQLRHFEEEARHAPYPFLMIELGNEHMPSPLRSFLRRTDFMLSAVLKMFWLLFELTKCDGLSKLATHHRFFKTLAGLRPKLKEHSLPALLGSLATSTPYISLFINPLYHPHTKKAVAKRKAFPLPFPQPAAAEVGW